MSVSWSWSWRKGAAALAVLLAASTLSAVGRPEVAQAAVANRLNNASFEARYDPPAESYFEANEWMESNKDGVAGGQTPSHSVSNGSVGSIYANTPDQSSASEYSAFIYPDPSYTSNPAILTQEVPTTYLAGRNPTISGYWIRTSGSSLGVKVTLEYATTCDGDDAGCLNYSGADCAAGDECGFINKTNCDYADTTNTTWESFSFSCDSTLPSEKIWEPTLVIEPTGTFATNKAIAVDDMKVDADDAQTYTAPDWTTGKTFTTMPGTADVIGISKRYATYTSTANTTYTSTSATDSSASWSTNNWAGGTVTQGSNTATVVSNTATQLTLTAAWSPSTPATGSVFTVKAPANVDNGIMREMYAMKSDGTGATRLTGTGTTAEYGYGNSVANPVDHSLIVAGRYMVDWDDNDEHNPLVDPMRLYVLDLAGDREKAITPPYWSAGLGGVEWTTDGRYIVFGVGGGRYWEIWKADTTNNYALSKVTSDTTACFESDVNTANFSHWVTYRKAAMVNGNCYMADQKGQIEIINLDYGSQSTVWTPSTAGLSDDGLPFGAYDPGFMADDSKLIFSNSAPDDGDADAFDSYDTDTIPVTGGTPTKLFGFPSIQDLAGDWTYAVAPFPQWNPAVADAREGTAFEITHNDSPLGYDYFGLATFNPAYDGDGTPALDYAKPDATGDNGLGHPRLIVGGHHNPTANSTPGGGFDYDPTNAYVRDLAYASAVYAQDEYHSLYTFNLEKSVPSGATIDGIRVRLEGAAANSSSSSPYVKAELSWDDGATWTATQDSAAWTTSSQDLVVGGTADTWGRTWSPSEMDNLRVRLQFKCTSSCPLRTWYLDHLDVRVFWKT